MIKITTEVVGAATVPVRIAAITPQVAKAIKGAVESATIELQAKIRAYLNAPRGESRDRLSRRTGRLGRSIAIRISESDNEISGMAGTNVVYGRFWELGFDGPVWVKAHYRVKKSHDVRQRLFDFGTGKSKRTKVATGITPVKGHVRKLEIKPRPFIKPSLAMISSSLQKKMREQVAKNIERIGLSSKGV